MSDGGSRLRRNARRWRERLWGNPGDWLSPRRKRFWAVVGLLLYTLAGFFLVPWIARAQIVAIAGAQLDRPVALERFRFNPFVLSAEARGFAVTEADGTAIVSFDRLYVNFQLSSLFRWAYTFREITLEGPNVDVVRFDDGSTNLGRLVPTSTAPAEAPPPDRDGPMRLIVQQLTLIDGGGRVTDHVPETTFVAPIGPINVTVSNISTLPDDAGEQYVAVHTERGASIAWQGTLQVEPLHSAGRFTADGPFLPLAYRYFQDQLGIELRRGDMALGFDYDIRLGEDGGIAAGMKNLVLALRDIEVVQEGRDVLRLPEVRLEGGHVAYPEQVAGARRLRISAPELLAWLEPDGTPNVQRIVASAPPAAPESSPGASPGASPEVSPEASPEASPAAAPASAAAAEPAADAATPLDAWTLTLNEFRLQDLQLRFEDRTLREPGRVHVTDLDIGVDGISNEPGARFPLTAGLSLAPGGRVEVEGEVGALPAPAVDVRLRVDALALAALQPYVADVAAVAIDDGTLTVQATVRVTDEEPLGAEGELTFDGLSVSDRAKDERLIGFTSLAVDRFDFSAADDALNVSEVTLDGPYVRLLIAEDQTTNFGALMVADEPADAAERSESDAAGPGSPVDGKDAAGLPVTITVGRVSVASGSADFTDLALPLPFRTTISALEGELSTLDTSSSEPSEVHLEGQIADYGLARIQGTLMPLGPTEQTDIELLFRNVALPDLTPYTIRFAGREIDDGRMEVELEYTLEDAHLVGRNRVTISDLALGDKVEHPDAFDLPLGLAVALLKGPDGRIDLDVPVEGNLDDPQFRIGRVVMGALANVITSIVSSPFRLLGNLVGAGESEDFGRVEFEPGSAAVAPPEREKLHKLAEALTLRPQLTLQIGGVFDPEADRLALKHQAVQARIDQALAAQPEEDAMLAERRRQALESLFSDDFPDLALLDVQAAHQRPADAAAPDGEQVLDETAYVADLQRRLVENTTIGDAALEALAGDRVAGTRSALTEHPEVDAGRVRIGEPVAVEATERGWVRMPLEVTAGG